MIGTMKTRKTLLGGALVALFALQAFKVVYGFVQSTTESYKRLLRWPSDKRQEVLELSCVLPVFVKTAAL